MSNFNAYNLDDAIMDSNVLSNTGLEECTILSDSQLLLEMVDGKKYKVTIEEVKE
ncbi:hypothetical protein D3C71_1083300 [compost metagenome]